MASNPTSDPISSHSFSSLSFPTCHACTPKVPKEELTSPRTLAGKTLASCSDYTHLSHTLSLSQRIFRARIHTCFEEFRYSTDAHSDHLLSSVYHGGITWNRSRHCDARRSRRRECGL